MSQQWEPIKTAPKDGTRILMVSAPWNTVRIAWFDEPHDSWTYSSVHEPTHWMPLPDPPKAEP